MKHIIMMCVLCCIIIPRYAGAQDPERARVSMSTRPAGRVVVEGREAPKPIILDPIDHQKRIYVDERKQLYVALSAPLFVRLALSPVDSDPAYLMHGPKKSQTPVPMYMDGPGIHTLRHPPGRGKPGYTYYLYADASAPTTTARFSGASVYMDDTGVYYGSEVMAAISAIDDMTGVQRIYTALNDSLYTLYKTPFTFTEEQRYRLRYYAVDNVGNSEAVAELNFAVDYTPPAITVRFSGPNTGRSDAGDKPVYPLQSMLEMEAADNLSGVDRLMYAINSDPEQPFMQPVQFDQAGDYTVVIRAIDNVGNAENQVLRFRVE